MQIGGGHKHANRGLPECCLGNAGPQEFCPVKICEQSGAQGQAQEMMADFAYAPTEHFPECPNHSNGHNYRHRRAQLDKPVSLERNVEMGEFQKDNDKTPDQEISQQWNPGFAAVRMPSASAH